MPADMNKVQEAIQLLVETKTFSLEGVKAIKELRDSYDMLKTSYDEKCKQFESFKIEHNQICADLERTIKYNKDLVAKEESVALREQKITRLEIEKECAEKMVRHTLGMFNTVFANAALKTTIMKDVVSEVHPGQNGAVGYPSVIKDVKETTIKEVGE